MTCGVYEPINLLEFNAISLKDDFDQIPELIVDYQFKIT